MENKKRSISTKTFAILLAVMLIIGCMAGGTIAWLTAKTQTTTNTFTYGDVALTLEETTTGYKIYPGAEIAKDPKVTVTAGSEDCYLFVKVEKSAAFKAAFDADEVTYEMADGWTELTEGSDIWYRTVSATEAGTAYAVLKDDKVSVVNTLTKERIAALKAMGDTELKFTAYAVQKEGIADAATAWTKANA